MHAQTQYTHECSSTHRLMYKGTHTHTYIHIHSHVYTHAPRAHHKYINLQLTHALAYNTYTHTQTDRHTHTHTHTHIHTHIFVCLFPLISSSLSKLYRFCIPSTFGSKLRHSRSVARGRYNMRGTKSRTWAFVPFILNFTPSF